jgi:hypothetical protein
MFKKRRLRGYVTVSDLFASGDNVLDGFTPAEAKLLLRMHPGALLWVGVCGKVNKKGCDEQDEKDPRLWVMLPPIRRDTAALTVKEGMGSIDPGVRTADTFYSAHGEAGEFLRGNPDGTCLTNMLLIVDHLRGRMTKRETSEVAPGQKRRYIDQSKSRGAPSSPAPSRKKKRRKKNTSPSEESTEDEDAPEPSPPPKSPLVETHARRWRMRRALWRIWDKKKNMIRDAHRKFALHMSRKFSVLLIPRFSAQGMVRKSVKKEGIEVVKGRNIGKGTVKAMLNWAHYSQRQRLLQLADRTEGFTVIEVVEPWTSRTCSACGYLVPKTRSKTFQCGQERCEMTCDRDLNAAKNILLRYVLLVCVSWWVAFWAECRTLVIVRGRSCAHTIYLAQFTILCTQVRN